MRHITIFLTCLTYLTIGGFTVGETTSDMDYSMLFGKYPADMTYSGNTAEVDFSSYPDSERFRTRLSQGIRKGPNYDRKYRVVEWGCGSNCTQISITDVELGQICAWITTCGASLYKLDSRLLIVNPEASEKAGYYPDRCETEFYILKDNKLEKLDQ